MVKRLGFATGEVCSGLALVMRQRAEADSMSNMHGVSGMHLSARSEPVRSDEHGIGKETGKLLGIRLGFRYKARV